MRLDDLIDKTLAILARRGYTQKTWEFAFRNGRFSSLREYFKAHGKEDFDVELAKMYILEIQLRYENGEFSYSRAAHLKKMAIWFIEVYETGELQWENRARRRIFLNEYFESVLACYLDSRKETLSFTSIRAQKSNILQMLDFFQHEKGFADFSRLSLKDIQEFIAFIGQKRSGRLDLVIYSTRGFLLFLKESNIIAADLTPALYLPAQRARKILAGFTREEVSQILAQPDRTTPIGKRDYAILQMGRDTGLRVGDIINMRITDIDWSCGEVSVVQKKTGHALVLPLGGETELAIIDYIRNGRPECNLSFLFLRHYAPYGALSQQTLTVLFNKYRIAANIPHVSGDGRSFHGLRRSIASWMLNADIPLTTISQVLGHRQLNSASPYLSIDEKNLKKCALSLDGITVCKEGLS